MKVRFEEIGEIRPPLEGEYFKEPSGFVNQAMFDFSCLEFPIMKRIIEEEEDETRRSNQTD